MEAQLIEALFREFSWEDFSDVLVEADLEDTKENAHKYFSSLPERIQQIAVDYGLCDTVFRDEALSYLTRIETKSMNGNENGTNS